MKNFSPFKGTIFLKKIPIFNEKKASNNNFLICNCY